MRSAPWCLFAVFAGLMVIMALYGGPVEADTSPEPVAHENTIVYVLSARPNYYHHHTCSRAKRRDAFPVRLWWARDRGAKPHRCMRGR